MITTVAQKLLSTGCTSFETLYLNESYDYLTELSDCEYEEAKKNGELKLSPGSFAARFRQQDNPDEDDDLTLSESLVKIKSREFHPNGSDLHIAIMNFAQKPVEYSSHPLMERVGDSCLSDTPKVDSSAIKSGSASRGDISREVDSLNANITVSQSSINVAEINADEINEEIDSPQGSMEVLWINPRFHGVGTGSVLRSEDQPQGKDADTATLKIPYLPLVDCNLSNEDDIPNPETLKFIRESERLKSERVFTEGLAYKKNSTVTELEVGYKNSDSKSNKDDKDEYDEESFGRTELFRPLLTPSERIMLGIAPVPKYFQDSSDEDDIHSLNLSALSISSKTKSKNKEKITSRNIKDSLAASVIRNKAKTHSFQRFKRFRPKGSSQPNSEPNPDKVKRYMRNEYGYAIGITINPTKRMGYFRRMFSRLQAAFRHFSHKSTPTIS